jgi:hypothetical protein
MISLQQLIALIILAFFIYRLIQQKIAGQISGNEFVLWLIFWIGSALAILFLKDLDKIASDLGFTASGINLLFYAATLILFYFIFKLRLRLAKLDRDLTDLNRELTLLKK